MESYSLESDCCQMIGMIVLTRGKGGEPTTSSRSTARCLDREAAFATAALPECGMLLEPGVWPSVVPIAAHIRVHAIGAWR